MCAWVACGSWDVSFKNGIEELLACSLAAFLAPSSRRAHITETRNTYTYTSQQQAHLPQEKGKSKGRRMVAAAAQEMLSFGGMEAGLRQWVKANPGRVNDRDRRGDTPLLAAVIYAKSLPLVVWLLDEKGADVNGTNEDGASAVHYAVSLDILTALLDRGADPIVADNRGVRPLMRGAQHGTVDVVAHLLQDPCVRATIDAQAKDGATALHWACYNCNYLNIAAPIVRTLLQAGADPTLTTIDPHTPLEIILSVFRHPHERDQGAITTIALFEYALAEAEKASLLVKARRLIVAASTSTTAAPSYVQRRVAQGQPLPHVALAPVVGQLKGKGADKEGEEARKFRTTLAYMCRLGREGMPRDVFRAVMDLVMPLWDPLRRKNAESKLPEGEAEVGTERQGASKTRGLRRRKGV